MITPNVLSQAACCSLERDDIFALSDRIAVIYEGRLMGIVDARSAERSQVGLMMAGMTQVTKQM